MSNFTEKPKNSKVLIIKCSAALVALITLIAGITTISVMSNTPSTINLTDYIFIKENGYDGYGSLEYEINTEGLANVIYAKEIEQVNIAIKGQELLNMIDVKIENNGSFANGDVANIVVDFNPTEEFDCEINGGTIEKTVSKLREVAVADLFKHFDLRFYRATENIAIVGASCNSDCTRRFHYRYVDFYFESDTPPEEGDTATVVAVHHYTEEQRNELAQHGIYFPAEQKKEIVVHYTK